MTDLVERLRQNMWMLEDFGQRDERPTLTGFGINLLHNSIAEAASTIEALSERIAVLEGALSGTHWTIERQDIATAIVKAVGHCDIGPSDDDGTLQIYDIIPDEWCSPDRSAATDLISENIAFAVLDAWLAAVRNLLTQEPQ